MPRELSLSDKEIEKIGSTVGRQVVEQLDKTCGIFTLLEFLNKKLDSTKLGIADAQAIYEKALVEKKDYTEKQARNSWVAKVGIGFQKCVQSYINRHLMSSGVAAVSASFIRKRTPDLKRFLSLPAKRRCVQQMTDLWPDNDIILVARDQSGIWRAFAILSCKTSFHARETEGCFYALAIRDLGIRTAMVTLDLDEELGTCQKPTKARQLLEMYFDATYVLNPATSLCPQILSFEDMCDNIGNWARALVPTMDTRPIEEREIA